MPQDIYSKAGADAATSAAISALGLGSAAVADAADFEAAGATAAAFDVVAVDQITLTAPLVLTVPAGFPAGQVYRVTLTQDATGRHTVTYGGSPVTVDLAPNAATEVEFWPGGKVIHPTRASAEEQTATYGPRWVFDGDSVTIGSIVTNTAGQDRNLSWTVELARLSMGRIDYRYNAALAGQNSAGALARFDTYVTPQSPDVVLLTIGTNDVGQSVPMSTWLANLDAYLSKCRSIDARLIIGAIWPTSSDTPAGRSATTRAWNDALREWAALNTVDLLPWDELADPDTGGWPTGWSGDAIHPTSLDAIAAIGRFGWDWVQHRAGPPVVRRARANGDGVLANGFMTALGTGTTATATSVTATATTGTLPANTYTYRITPRGIWGENAVSYADVTQTLGAPGGITLTRTIAGSYNAWAIYRKSSGESAFRFMAAVGSATATWTDDGSVTPGHDWIGTNTSRVPSNLVNGKGTTNWRTLAFGPPIRTEAGVRGNVLRLSRYLYGTDDSFDHFEAVGLTPGNRIVFSCLARSAGASWGQVILRWRSASASISNTVVAKMVMPEWGMLSIEAVVPAGADRVRVSIELDDISDYIDVAELLVKDD